MLLEDNLLTAIMKITRIYTGPDGELHFEDLEIKYLSSGPIGKLSAWQPVTRLAFRETGANYDFDRHVAPRR